MAQSMSDEFSTQQGIKCVVVGDRGVGKSHLVSARAMGSKYTILEVLKTSVSTVFAIDQYRDNIKVKARSQCSVDGVHTMLRIWDTFGIHDRDRQFAYKKADVVVVCFSVINRRSLIDIELFWLPEIRSHCGDVPIIVCACKIDMRYIYKDPVYLNLPQGSFFRKYTAADIVLPAEGREMASKVGAVMYYETSVVCPFGVHDVFNNAIRAVFIYKRRKKLLSSFGNLKNVMNPQLQGPHLPVKPSPPQVAEVANVLPPICVNVLDLQLFCDVIFLSRNVKIHANLVSLIAASPSFAALVLDEFTAASDPSKPIRTLSASTECTLRRLSTEECSEKDADELLSSLLTPEAIADGAFHEKFGWKATETTNEATKTRIAKTISEDVVTDYSSSEEDKKISVGQFVRSSITRTPRRISDKSLLQGSVEANYVEVGATGDAPAHDYKPGSNRHRSVSARVFSDPTVAKCPSSAERVRSLEDSVLGLESFTDLNVESSLHDGSDSGILTQSTSVESCIPSAFVSRAFGEHNGEKVVMVTIDDSIAPSLFRAVLDFLYTGKLPTNVPNIKELRRVASMMGITDLESVIAIIGSDDEEIAREELLEKFQDQFCKRVTENFIEKDLLSDCTIYLKDGAVQAHRALLVGRCEVMRPMFSSDFSESTTKSVDFEDISVAAFTAIKAYLYTGRCPLTCPDWEGVLQLSNLLGLDHLFALAEVAYVKQLRASPPEASESNAQAVLNTFQLARLYDAEQLIAWCLWYLTVDYQDFIKIHLTAVQELPIEVQKELEENQWPPQWYWNEKAMHEKMMASVGKMKPENYWLKRPDGQSYIKPGGCFAFNASKKK